MRQLSKSKIIAFRQCPKRLWLELHKPELREDSESTQAAFNVGYQVGDVAKKIYDPESKGTEVDAQRDGFKAAFAQSEKLLAESKQPIFEAGLRINGALAFADVMLPVEAEGPPAWRMVEVKSSTSVKDYHHDDIAVQSYIAQAAGVKLQSVALACIDSSWVYPGDNQYQGLLQEHDLTAEVFARSEEVKGWLAQAQEVAALETEPVIETGDHCYAPFECGFCGYCNQGKPQPLYPLAWLPRLSASVRTQLAEQGIDSLEKVPDELLNWRQQRVKHHTLDRTTCFDAEKAAKWLAPHGFPAYFLDFETINFAVPIWKGTRPYQQIPFQFSLHTLDASRLLRHCEFLDVSGQDPSEGFARALVDNCGTTGPVYVYNASFERTRIVELADRFPTLSDQLMAIWERVVDLLPVAINCFYHPSQHGSWSIKAVLPAAIPELSYNALDGVKDGDMAMDAFKEALQQDTTPERKRQIETELIAYCSLDTWAMVRLWQYFSGHNEPISASP